LGIGLGYFVIIALYVPIGAPPRGPQALLAYIGDHRTTWQGILWLSVVTDALFLPVALALFETLKGVSRSAVLLAVSGIILFVVLDLALTWPNYAALMAFSERYAAAGASDQAILVTAAEYPASIVQSQLLFVYNSLTLAVGTLAAGVAMKKGPFSKGAAYLGVTTGLLGVIAVIGPLFAEALSFAIVIASLLTAVWLLVVGRELSRAG
jgi:hypothetical protein